MIGHHESQAARSPQGPHMHDEQGRVDVHVLLEQPHMSKASTLESLQLRVAPKEVVQIDQRGLEG